VAGTARPVVLDRAGGEWAIAIRDADAGGNGSGDSATTTMARTLDDILAAVQMHGPIDLLKCDIEGAEQDLFAHCAPWIARIQNLIIEVHPPYTKALLLADLRSAGGDFDCREVFDGLETVLLLKNRRDHVA